MLPDITAWNARILDINNAPTKIAGLITEVKAPMFEREFDTDKRAGELGVVPRPKHIKEIEVSFKTKKINRALIKALMESIASINRTISIQATAVVDTDTSTRDVYIWTATGYMGGGSLGDLSSDGLESEFKLMCTKVDATYGTDTYQYDPVAYLFSINGVNQWANIKTAIGV